MDTSNTASTAASGVLGSLIAEPGWQFAVNIGLSAFGIVAGVGVALLIYRLQRQTKEVAFGEVSSSRLLSIADEVAKRVTIQLDGVPVQNLHLVIFGCKNSGRVAIEPGDFVRPLQVVFHKSAVVASVEIGRQNPKNLGATVSLSSNRVTLDPLLLNVGEYCEIKVLLAGPIVKSELDGRVTGASIAPINNGYKFHGPTAVHATKATGLSTVAICLVFVLAYKWFYPGAKPLNWEEDSSLIVLMVLCFSFYIVGFVLWLLSKIGFSSNRYID